MKKELAIGLMSGTSADGLTIALCEICGKKIKTLSFKNYDYSPKLHDKIIKAKDLKGSEISELNFELGRLWATMVCKFLSENKIKSSQITSIASHGQTIWHYPHKKGHTLQIGEASFISEETGIPTVCDFRPIDMAAGGEGAPLVPFMDEYLYGNGDPVALQNIGGVGNISFVGNGIKTFGFDTGPGNSLMDTAITIFSNGKKSYDKDGKYASIGIPDKRKVEVFLKNSFFKKNPPKSLDRSEFTESFIFKNFDLKKSNFPDVMATLNLFTAASISFAFKKYAPAGTKKLIVAGGGALNPVLMRNIKELLSQEKVIVKSSAEEGLHPLAKEASCFALMGLLAFHGKYNHCPSATGAHGMRVLGKIINIHK